jgi:hypothetical protein
MQLEQRLEAIRTMAKTRIPADAQAIMRQSIEDLRASGIMERVAKRGAPAPDFTLPNAAGKPVALKELVARGPVVLSFYRGRW